MIYDSPEQKQFILEAVKKFPCNYEQALQLANTFGKSIQDGQIIPLKDQPAAKPAKAGQAVPVRIKPNRQARRAVKKATKKGKKG